MVRQWSIADLCAEAMETGERVTIEREGLEFHLVALDGKYHVEHQGEKADPMREVFRTVDDVEIWIHNIELEPELAFWRRIWR